jgi:hypothetical protein
MAKKQEDELPMPAGWSKVNKKDFGISTNVMSFIVAGLTLLCVLLCILHWRFPGNSMESLRTMMHSSRGACAMVIVAAVPAILLGITRHYEIKTKFSVLNEEVKDVPFAMSVILFAYYVMRAVCLGQCIGPDSRCDMKCSVANSLLPSVVVAIAAGTLIYFTVMRFYFEDPMDYNNLEQKVPEAEPLKL